MASMLSEVDAPTGSDMDAHLRYTVSYRTNVPEQPLLEPPDASGDDTAHRGIDDMVEPAGELRERLDGNHRQIVIDR